MGCTTQRARLAALRRHRSADDPLVADAARDLAAQRLEDHIRRVVDQAPPLTAQQRDRIGALLRGPLDRGTAESGGNAA